MPVKNRIKQYLANGYYHLYNRGVEKRVIFQDHQDYYVLLSYLKEYLEPKNSIELQNKINKAKSREKDKIIKQLSMNNFCGEISLISFCLMPNHFHLLIQQTEERSIEKFMKSVFTRYVMYFNKKYQRVGGLFQSVYKAVMIKTDEQLIHVSRYIHQNPLSLRNYKSNFIQYPYSSLKAFLNLEKINWVKSEIILSNFTVTNPKFSYQEFISNVPSENEQRNIEKLTLDNDPRTVLG